MRDFTRIFVLIAVAAGFGAVLLVATRATNGATPEPETAAVIIATTEPAAAATEVATPVPTSVATPEPTAQATVAARPVGPPQAGRWIDVDVSNYTVRLMNGSTATKTIGPVGVGAQINTGAYESTQTGLFYVYSMDATLTYDAPYDTYISHWVGFDPALANGFHSFLKDVNGKVVNASTGRISNGCIRTGDPEAIYAFAEIGMPVWVHL